jgi:uncharacterized protein YbjT (DUF2867 family)
VFVTAADGALGRRLTVRLLAEGGQVRAYATGSGDVGALRGAGAFVASGDLDDVGLLDAAMTDVHTVVHTIHGVLAGSAAVVEEHGRAVIAAAAAAEVSRLILLSVPGADPAALDELRRVHGRLEAFARDAPMPTLVVRVSLLDESRLRDALASSPSMVAEHGDVEVAPVRADDLVEGLVALDAARSEATSGHAVFLADGPRTTLRGYVERVGVGGGALVGRVYTPPERVPLLWDSLSTPWVSDRSDGADLWEFAGHRPRPVA